MKAIYISFILIITTSVIYAQTGTIKGRVFDKISNEPLPFVNIIISGTSIGTVSDLDGNFVFTGLQPAFVQLNVSFVGYNQATSPEIQVSNSKSAYVDIPMEQNDLELAEVQVKASRFTKTQESPVSLRQIGLTEIENNPGSNRDISKVIQAFPGIGSTVSFRNDIIVRGGGPNESRFFLDGVEIPNMNHFATQGSSGGPVGIINADFISSVNYYAGAFPANRGNALSGIFEFTQIDGNKDKLSLSAIIGASDFGLTLDGPLGDRTSFIFSARQSYLQFLFETIGLPFLPIFNDFQLKSRTRIDEKNEFIIIGLGAIDQFELNTKIKNPTEEQKYILDYLPVNEQWNYTLGTVYKHFRKNSYQTVVFSRNMLNNESFKYLNNDESSDNNLILKYKSQEIENKFRYENNLRFKHFKIIYGIGTEFAKYNNKTMQKIFTNNQLTTINYNSKLELFKYNLFSQASKNLFNEKLSISLGIRVDGNNYSNSMNKPWEQLSPRLSTSYAITQKTSFNANAGRYYQLPSYTTLGYRNNSGDLVNKNNNLKYIRVEHIIAGFEYNIRKYWILTLESFFKTYSQYPFSIRDSISIANKGGDFGVVGDEEVVSTGDGRSYGFEIFNKLKTDNGLNYILSYTYVRSEFKNKSDKFIPSSWDSRHLLTISASKSFKKTWNAGLKWRFVGGLPYTPYNLEKSELVQAWDTQGKAFLDYNRINSERLPIYHQLDIRIDKKFFFKKWSLTLYVDIQNLYNYKAEQPDNIVKTYDENGNAIIQNPNASIEEQRYQLKKLKNESGTILPTLGIIIRI